MFAKTVRGFLISGIVLGSTLFSLSALGMGSAPQHANPPATPGTQFDCDFSGNGSGGKARGGWTESCKVSGDFVRHVEQAQANHPGDEMFKLVCDDGSGDPQHPSARTIYEGPLRHTSSDPAFEGDFHGDGEGSPHLMIQFANERGESFGANLNFTQDQNDYELSGECRIH